MAKVPSYSVPQVEARNLPNVRITDAPAREIATAGQAISRGLADLGHVGHQIAQREQQKVDTAAQLRAENELAALENQMLHDPEHGAFARRGQEVEGLTQQVLPQWDRNASSIVGKLPRRLQTWGHEQVAKRRQDAERQLMRHTLQQSQAYLVQQGQSLQANAQNAAALNYLDPERVDTEITRGMVAVDRVLDMQGADDITRQHARTVYASQTQRKVIERMLVNDPMQARARLGQVRERLTSDDQVALDEQLQVIESDLQGDVDVSWALRGGVVAADSLYEPSDGRAPPPVPAAVRTVIETAADRYGVPRALALAMAQQESGFNPGAVGPETKWGRARGLYQYIDDTAKAMGIDPTDPSQAADAAMRQLAAQAAEKGWDWAIAHHHAGPNPRQHGPKTQSYVAQVREKARRFHAASGGEAPTVQAQGPASTIAEALERIRTIPDPRRRRVAEAKARQQFEVQDLRRKEAQRDVEDQIYQQIVAADPNAPLRQVLAPEVLALAARSESLMADIARFRKEAAAGPVIDDDPATLDHLFRLQATDPQTFAALPLARYGTRLTGKTMKDLAEDQLKLRSGRGESREYATLGQQLATVYQKLDWEVTGKQNADERGQFLSAYMTLARNFDQANKRKPTAAERDQLIESLLTKQARVVKGNRTGKPAALWERLQTVPQIDAGTRRQIVEGWQAVNGRNREPTDKEIYALYFMENGAPK